MKTGMQQSVRMGQELKVNPRLYQAMDMLYMPLLDLQQHLKQELLVNPFLDLVEEEEDEAEAGEETAQEADAEQEAEAGETASAADSDDESQWEEILLNGFDVGGVREERDDREHYEPTTVATRGLDDHLRDQIRLLDLSERDELLAEEFIGNINEEGFLSATLDEIVAGVNEMVTRAAAAADDDREMPFFTLAEAEHMLGVMQSLDPPGIAARTLHECLTLQLKDAGLEGTLSERIVREHFQELVAHRWVDIARKVGATPTEVQTAADAVAKLNPKPGRAYSSGSDNYVVPDLIVEKIDGEYLVFINDANLPRLKLSRAYQEIARDKKKFNGENKEFITSRLSAAQWLIQAIEQRRQTMLKVMHFIVDRQRDFFEKGVQGLRPLTLREVAEAIGMHESTVSRVTNEKFAQTPRGVLPLKFFFSSGIKSSDGEDVSARGIRATIEKLVNEEDPKNPLTDQALVEILERDGVQIARRTVAKYRDQLGVLPARMRKRL
ncbi:MAG TPA: RNA polymerase factor sigma-54 [Gemmatimonadaceae bacterium]|nr:RNA polymerase factor sigma-54 [Gemmatimonadaceae bacterium]